MMTTLTYIYFKSCFIIPGYWTSETGGHWTNLASLQAKVYVDDVFTLPPTDAGTQYCTVRTELSNIV